MGWSYVYSVIPRIGRLPSASFGASLGGLATVSMLHGKLIDVLGKKLIP